MQTDLSYVRERLKGMKRGQLKELGDEHDISETTMRRIARPQHNPAGYFPRSDAVGKLALHFRTREKRGK